MLYVLIRLPHELTEVNFNVVSNAVLPSTSCYCNCLTMYYYESKLAQPEFALSEATASLSSFLDHPNAILHAQQIVMGCSDP